MIEDNSGPRGRITPRSTPNGRKGRQQRRTHRGNSNQKFLVMQVNIDGIASKRTELVKRLSQNGADVVAIQETKLNRTNPPPALLGYVLAAHWERAPKSTTGLVNIATDNIDTNTDLVNDNAVTVNTNTDVVNKKKCRARFPNQPEEWCGGCSKKKKCVRYTDTQVTNIAANTAPIVTSQPRRKKDIAIKNRGGGVAIWIKEGTPYKALTRQEMYNNEEDKATEMVGIEIWKNKKQTIRIMNIYVPPARWGAEGGTQVHAFNPDKICTRGKFVLCGDVNAHGAWDRFQPEDKAGRDLDEWMTSKHLVCHNTRGASRINRATGGKSTPDVTIAKASVDISNWQFEDDIGSDHAPITFEISIKVAPKRQDKKWNYKKADWDLFREIISQNEEPIQNENIDQQNNQLTNIILEAAKKSIPRGGRKAPKPFWSDKCEDAVDARKSARKVAENAKDETTVREYNKKRKEAEVTIREEKRAYYKEKAEELGVNADLWNTLKRIEGGQRDNNDGVAIERPAGLGNIAPSKMAISDKEKADLFIQTYAKVARIKKNKTSDKIIKQRAYQAKRKICEKCPDQSHCRPFSKEELNRAIKKIKRKKSAGPDEITNEMLKELPKEGKDRLLNLVNESWRTQKVPSKWRTAHIIPLKKKGKPAGKPDSYRPVALTSCLAKLMERMVAARLVHWLENNNKLSRFQAGFRKNRSTVENVIRFCQTIFDGFEKRPHHRSMTTLLDFSKAYDRVWKDGLTVKLEKMGTPTCWIKWIMAFLADRRARTRWNNVLSRSMILSEGLPQGSVLSPILWLVYMNDIDECFEDIPVSPVVDRCYYADDTAVLVTGKDINECQTALQTILDKIGQWAHEWKVELSPGKCVTTVYSLDNKDNFNKFDPLDPSGRIPPTMFINDKMLPYEAYPTLLGIKMDGQLTFGKHVEKVKKKMASKRYVMNALAGKSFGADEQILRTIYTACIRSVADYGSAVWATHTAPSNMEKVEAEQNMAARCITGMLRSTRTEVLRAESGLNSLHDRAETAAATYLERFRRMPREAVVHGITSTSIRPRLKSRAPDKFYKDCWRRAAQRTSERAGLSPNDAEHEQLNRMAPWESEDQVIDRISWITSIVDHCSRTDAPEVRKAAADLVLGRMEQADVTIWTDGSVKGENSVGGGGGIITYGDIVRHVKVATGKASSSYVAEMTAINAVLEHVETMAVTECCIRCHTDSLSSIQALKKGPIDSATGRLEACIWARLISIARNNLVEVVWVPSHCDLEMNEMADRLADEAVGEPQDNIKISLNAAKIVLKKEEKGKHRERCKEAKCKEWMENTEGNKADVQGLNRWEVCTLHQFRGNRSSLTREGLFRSGQTVDPFCINCGGEVEDTVRHLLVDCPEYDGARQVVWGCVPTLSEAMKGPNIF
jgi:ribonuclease HI/exonuclease III